MVNTIETHLKNRRKLFRDTYGRELKQAFCWSDNGEFRCTGFLKSISKIAHDMNLTIIWNFTAGGHSKGKHDGEGSVIKRAYRAAVSARTLRFNIQKESYSETLRRYMQLHFDRIYNQKNSNRRKRRKFIKRTFPVIP